MQTGFLVLILSGICQGSFGLGYKKYSPLSWEAFWGVYSLFCLIIASTWTFAVSPDVCGILRQCGLAAFAVPFLCGVVWGLSTIAFSKSVIMIGMSLCFGINMGISSIVGTVTPFVTSGSAPVAESALYLTLGIIITLIGISVITIAGLMKDKVQFGGKTLPGVLLAVVSGLCSGIMNVGFDKASAMGAMAANDIAAGAVQWFPVLVGGMTASFVFCLVIALKKHSLKTLGMSGAAPRFVQFFVTAVVWFAALALYGISSKMLGRYGSSIGWLIFNAVALIVSSFLGVAAGEWKNAARAKVLLCAGDLVLIIAWVFVMRV